MDAADYGGDGLPGRKRGGQTQRGTGDIVVVVVSEEEAVLRQDVFVFGNLEIASRRDERSHLPRRLDRDGSSAVRDERQGRDENVDESKLRADEIADHVDVES